jgi:hypothetical protein
MKLSIALLIMFCSFLWHDNPYSKTPPVVIKAILLSSYDFPQNDIRKLGSDSLCYFLFDIKILNISKKPTKFIIYDCTPGSNIVMESTQFIKCANTCLGNSRMFYELKPSEELTFPLIVKTKSINSNNKIRIGWAFLTKENVGNVDNYFNVLEKAFTTFENVIWSDLIQLDRSGGKPIQLRSVRE